MWQLAPASLLYYLKASIFFTIHVHLSTHIVLVKCNLKFGATDFKMSQPEDRVLYVEQGPFAPLIVA